MSNNNRERPILYDPRKAIEHIQTIPGLVPVRFFAVLFPLWYVEVTGKLEQSRPYELIEQYIERGIEEGQLHTTGTLADFFGLDSRLVEKVLVFLETTRHVTYTNGMWYLTDLGRRSVIVGRKIIPKETRQKLYFDAFHSRPLLREHYGNNLQIVEDFEADEITQSHRGGYQFHRLTSFQPWNPVVVSDLERRSDRALYNLREEIHNLQPIDKMQVYLPMYIFETRKHNGELYYVVYTHIRGRRDEFFEDIVNTYPEIQIVLSVLAEKVVRANERWAKWLASRGVPSALPVQLATGVWQVVLPKEAFRSQPEAFSVAEIGTYRLDEGYFLQIWCDDIELRRNAALDRTLKIIKSRKKSITGRDVEENLQRLAEQLRTRKLELTDVRQRAVETGLNEVVSTIDY
jgi:hypothetical protein